MSKTHQLPIVDGVTAGYRTSSEEPKARALAFDVAGGAPAGTITVRARFPGASYFEAITDAIAVPLATPYSVQFGGPVAEYEVTLAGVSGITSLSMTDTTED